MAVAAADIKAYFPELTTVDDAIVTRWLAVAQLKHNATAFGGKSDIALVCLTAHFVELHKRRLAGQTGSSGLVQSRSVGDVSTTYATPATGASLEANALAATAYGQMYLDLRLGVFADRVIE